MRTGILKRLRSDDGFSLVTALLITLVVFALSTVSVSLSRHDNNQSGRNRERVNAVAAAEAGLNYEFSKLQAGDFGGDCTTTQNLGSFPTSTFVTTLTAYDTNGVALACPPPSTPKMRVLIRSVGSATGDNPRRTMEAMVELERPAGGTLGEGAIFGEGDIFIDSNPNIGNPAGEFNADIYSNGNIELKSNPVIVGNVTAQKCVRMDSFARVYVDVWAKGGAGCAWSSTITMLSDTRVNRDIIATTGPVEFNSNAKVIRDAKSGGTMTWSSPCTGGSNSCGPNVHPRVAGMALRNQSGLVPPPIRSFPTLVYNAADWTAAGYTIQTYTTCSSAKSAIGTNNTVKRVIRITSTCELLWSNSSSPPITLSEDLAIVTDGTIFIDSGTRFVSSSPTTPRTFHMLVAQLSTHQPDYCFQMKSTTRIEAPISTLVYVPKKTDGSKCKVFLDSNADIAQGQIFGGNKIEVKSNTDLAYMPVITPGAPTIGFKESIIYIREVTSS